MKRQITALMAAALLLAPVALAQQTPASKTEKVTCSVKVKADSMAVDTVVEATTEIIPDVEMPETEDIDVAPDGLVPVTVYRDTDNRLLVDDAYGGVRSLDYFIDGDYYVKQIKRSPGMIVAIIGIIFGVPSLAVILGLWLLFHFLHRRNRERNELIAKAIDADYELPESFYTRQATYPQNAGGAATSPAGEPDAPAWVKGMIPVSQCNSRTFSTGITLTVIGLVVVLFFLVVDELPLGVLLGGIPLLLGIAKLIGYFYIPGYDYSRSRQVPPQYPNYNHQGYNRPPYGQRPPYYQQPQNYQQPQQPGNPGDGQCPPPYNH